jgi:hypothetical protein
LNEANTGVRTTRSLAADTDGSVEEAFVEAVRAIDENQPPKMSGNSKKRAYSSSPDLDAIAEKPRPPKKARGEMLSTILEEGGEGIKGSNEGK